MKGRKLTICLTGATGWLGTSLLQACQTPQEQHNFFAYGRSQTTITTDTGLKIKNFKFDLKDITSREFDVFAPFAFATREKLLQMESQKYITLNREIISDAVKVIRGGKVGSVLNISSGVVIQKSESQLQDKSYSIYANLKRFQEETFADACDSVGIPLINCRVFSLSGKDMKQPLKYAIGNLVSQAITKGSIQLSSMGCVVRRYMDSRDLMNLLLEYVKQGDSVSVESGGERIELSELAKLVLKEFYLPTNLVTYADTVESSSNEYFSLKNDFEEMAQKHKFPLAGIKMQIVNVATSIKHCNTKS